MVTVAQVPVIELYVEVFLVIDAERAVPYAVRAQDTAGQVSCDARNLAGCRVQSFFLTRYPVLRGCLDGGDKSQGGNGDERAHDAADGKWRQCIRVTAADGRSGLPGHDVARQERRVFEQVEEGLYEAENTAYHWHCNAERASALPEKVQAGEREPHDQHPLVGQAGIDEAPLGVVGDFQRQERE